MGDEFQSNWMRALPFVLLSRRTSYHNIIKATPAQLVFGEDPRLPGDLTPLQEGQTSAQLLSTTTANVSRQPY